MSWPNIKSIKKDNLEALHRLEDGWVIVRKDQVPTNAKVFTDYPEVIPHNAYGGQLGDVLTRTDNQVWGGQHGWGLDSSVTPPLPTLAELDLRYVNITGDNMVGHLGLGMFNIINLLDPINPQDGATKFYVDAAVSSPPPILLNLLDRRYVNTIGDQMTGPLSMLANGINDLLDPILNQDAATKIYVDTLVATGNPYMGAWQVAANFPDLTGTAHLNGSKYLCVTVDPAIPEVCPPGVIGIAGLTIADGDFIIWDAAAQLWNHISNAGLTIPVADTLYVSLTGDRLTGPLYVPLIDPVLPEELATKDYVDKNAGEVIVQDTPPIGTPANALWWDSDSGGLFINYQDIDSLQWVHLNGSQPGAATVTVSDWSPTSPTTNMLWWNSLDANLYLWHNDGNSFQWVQVNGDAQHVLKSGDTMTGGLTVGGGLNANGGVHVNYGANARRYVFQPAANGVATICFEAGHQNNNPAADMRINPGVDNGSGGTWEWFRRDGGYGDGWIMKTTNDSEPGLRVNGSVLGSQMLVRSDASLKQDIRYDASNTFLQAFDALKPAMYRLKDPPWPPMRQNGTIVENPVHTIRRDRFGFITNDMIKDDNLTLVVETPETNSDEIETGYDIAQILAITVAKVKLLETEILELKGAR